ANGSVVAALSISVPVTRISPTRAEELATTVQRAARELSHRLGYAGSERTSIERTAERIEMRRRAVR
ncbi:MAG: IclR family transcriptional regulator C-terminal domain-containing protein, partial [Thermomicrobium sp.]|nr:IclR family transcriptional regulator C-terminal domain-containing protein [Thermomicrobium sp.]